MRNGTVVDWSSIQPITDLDILNGTLSERKLYPFGQSCKNRCLLIPVVNSFWLLEMPTYCGNLRTHVIIECLFLFFFTIITGQVPQNESIFNYTGGNDTYAIHNPSPASEPPFLEDLVAAQRNTSLFSDIVSNCTSNDVLSTTCLYDVLTTNRSDIGANTLSDGESSTTMAASNGKYKFCLVTFLSHRNHIMDHFTQLVLGIVFLYNWRFQTETANESLCVVESVCVYITGENHGSQTWASQGLTERGFALTWILKFDIFLLKIW